MTEADVQSVEALGKVACSIWRCGIELARVAKMRGAMKRGAMKRGEPSHMERKTHDEQ
jgi:hypothetical protein